MAVPFSRRRFVARSAIAGAAAACALPLLGAAPETVLRLSLPTGANHPTNLTMMKFAAMVAQRSNGSLRVEIYLNGSLAKEQASITGLQTGVVDMTTQTTAFLEPLIPRVQALDLPFLFARRQNAERLLDGDVGRELFAELAQKGIVGLAWGTAGWRELEFRDTRVRGPADMRGLRMRVQNGPVYVSMMKALGATPVIIDFSETYTALAQKTIDGLDIPLTTILAQKFNEVTRNIALSNHLYNPGPLLMSKQRYDSLGSEQQRALVDASREIVPIWRNTFADAHTAAIAELKSKGVAVDAIDYPAFKRAMTPVYDEYRERLGRDVVDRIIKIAG